MLEVGDKVKDKISGFEGVATARAVYLNGCVRIQVQGVRLKDGIPTESQWIDEVQLRVTKKGESSFYKVTGGSRPNPKPSGDPK